MKTGVKRGSRGAKKWSRLPNCVPATLGMPKYVPDTLGMTKYVLDAVGGPNCVLGGSGAPIGVQMVPDRAKNWMECNMTQGGRNKHDKVQ